MKYFYPNKENRYLYGKYIPKYEFITRYELIDDQIIVYYANNERKERLKYSKEKEYLIQNIMKNQIKDSSSLQSGYIEELKHNNLHNIFNLCFLYYSSSNYIQASDNKTKIIYGTAFVLFLTTLNLRLFDNLNNKERLNEIKKYKFFIENEDLINYETIKSFIEESESNAINYSLENLISINDIDNMTLIELKEIVELIKQNYNEDEIKLNLDHYSKIKGTY